MCNTSPPTVLYSLGCKILEVDLSVHLVTVEMDVKRKNHYAWLSAAMQGAGHLKMNVLSQNLNQETI